MDLNKNYVVLSYIAHSMKKIHEYNIFFFMPANHIYPEWKIFGHL